MARMLLVIVAALALFATACGGGGGSGLTSEESSAAVTAGSTNEPLLELTADTSTTQLLNTRDGSITSLSEVVTGDRPVLLWFWAPH